MTDKKIRANLLTNTAEVICDWCFGALDGLPFPFQEVDVCGGKCAYCDQPFRFQWMSFGRREREESTTKYVVFDLDTVLKEAQFDAFDRVSEEQLEDAAIKMSGFYRFYQGPGRGFGNTPVARVGRSRVLVTQFCGLDI